MADIVPIKNHGLYEREARQSAARTLNQAKARKPKQVLVIFIDAAGELGIGGSPNNPAEAMWLMEMCKAQLLGLRN